MSTAVLIKGFLIKLINMLTQIGQMLTKTMEIACFSFLIGFKLIKRNYHYTNSQLQETHVIYSTPQNLNASQHAYPC